MGQKQNKRKEPEDEPEDTEDEIITPEKLGVPEYVRVIEYKDLRLLKILGAGGACASTYKSMLLRPEECLCAFRCIKVRGPIQFWFPSKEIYTYEHVNLIKPYGVVISPPRFGFVEEYIDGWDLYSFVMRSRISDDAAVPHNERIHLISELLNLLKQLEIFFPDFLATIALSMGEIFVVKTRPDVEDEQEENSVNSEPRYRIKFKYIGLETTEDHENRLSNKPRYAFSRNVNPPELGSGVPLTPKTAVFHFAFIAYEILNMNIVRELNPQFPEWVEKDYPWMIDLLKRCWSEKIDERPTFCMIMDVFERYLQFLGKSSMRELEEERMEFLKIFCDRECNRKDVLEISINGNEGQQKINVMMKYVILGGS